MATMAADVMTDVRTRVDDLDWSELDAQLDDGATPSPPVLLERGRVRASWPVCSTAAGFARRSTWRATASATAATATSTTRCPSSIPALRAAFYAHLAPIANRWSERLRGDTPTFPLAHEELLERCRDAGQTRPTPLILRYGRRRLERAAPGPLRRGLLPLPGPDRALRRGVDYEGGEFVLMEQRPRAQSRAHVLTPAAGRVRHLPHPRAPERRHAPAITGSAAPRRRAPSRRRAHRARSDLP